MGNSVIETADKDAYIESNGIKIPITMINEMVIPNN